MIRAFPSVHGEILFTVVLSVIFCRLLVYGSLQLAKQLLGIVLHILERLATLTDRNEFLQLIDDS